MIEWHHNKRLHNNHISTSNKLTTPDNSLPLDSDLAKKNLLFLLQLCPLKQIVFHKQEILFLSLTEWFRKIYIIFWFFFWECWWKCSHNEKSSVFPRIPSNFFFSLFYTYFKLKLQSSSWMINFNVIHKSTKYTWSL